MSFSGLTSEDYFKHELTLRFTSAYRIDFAATDIYLILPINVVG
jgi:hypothetical protein